jgi:hypothetical protein
VDDRAGEGILHIDCRCGSVSDGIGLCSKNIIDRREAGEGRGTIRELAVVILRLRGRLVNSELRRNVGDRQHEVVAKPVDCTLLTYGQATKGLKTRLRVKAMNSNRAWLRNFSS